MSTCTPGHEAQCLSADPLSECKCDCGGENHGDTRKRMMEQAKDSPVLDQRIDKLSKELEELLGDKDGI